MDQNSNDVPPEGKSARKIGMFLTLGIAIGVAIGVAMDNLAVGVGPVGAFGPRPTVLNTF